MLGNGRPFIVEIKRPRRRNLDLNAIAEEINASGRVEVLNLHLVSAKEAEEVLTGNHRKEYLALVRVDDGVTPEEAREVAERLRGGIEIHQRTPWRVRKARADRIRIKKVHEAEARWLDGRHFELRLVTDGASTSRSWCPAIGGGARVHR